MKHTFPFLLAILLAAMQPALAASPAQVLHPYVATYEVLRAGQVSGEARIELKSTGDGTWQMRSQTRGTQGLAALAGLQITETSSFSANASGLLSCGQYRYRQTGLKKRERSIDCEPGEAGIISRDHKSETRFPARSGAVDRQIASLAVALELAAGKRGEVSVPVVDRGRLETDRYRFIGDETLKLPIGPTHTLKLERLHHSGQRKTMTWFAMDQGWVPVRIVHSGEDGGYELRLVSLQR